MLDYARPGATLLLNSPFGPDEVWDHLPREVQAQILDKGIEVWVIDADAVARDTGMGNRINTIMQPCFFQLAGVLPADEAIARIKGIGRGGLRTAGPIRGRTELRRDRHRARPPAPDVDARRR